MRVLHIGKFYPPHMGGIETHLETLSRELSGHASVQVIVANDRHRRSHSCSDGITVMRMARMFTIASTPICLGMVTAIRRAAAQIIHLHTPNPFGALAYLLSGRRVPLVLTWHSDVLRQKCLAKAFAPIDRAVLKLADAIVATSENYLQTSRRLAAYSSKCRVIPYGISLEKFCHSDWRAHSIRERFGPRIVLAVGRLVYYKGFVHLIRAIKSVQATLLIIGDGPLRRSLLDEAARLGVSERVKFIGELSNQLTVSYYQASDVFVLPSVARTEAFGIVQVEAMASGLPVINTALDSGVPAVSLDGVTGITVPPANSEALAEAINLLLSNSELRLFYGENGKRRAREFSAPAMGSQTLQLYRDVLNRGDRGRFAPAA